MAHELEWAATAEKLVVTRIAPALAPVENALAVGVFHHTDGSLAAGNNIDVHVLLWGT